MTTRIRAAGEFCWINIITRDPSAAREFFTAVFDWGYVEMPGLGHRIQVDGHDIGGLWDLEGPQVPAGTAPGIGVMVKADDADAIVARTVELGGRSKPAFDVFDQGRMAECVDPTGARIDIWQPKAGPGTDADPRRHGSPSWFEVMTTDPSRAATFYQGLFGWDGQAMAMPTGTYTMFSLDGAPVAGMMEITPEMGEIPPHWGTYFTVADADAAAETAAANGATIFIPPRDVPAMGRFAGVISPHGVRFYVFAYA